MKKIIAGGVVLLAVGMFNVCAYADGPVVGVGKKVTLDYTLFVENNQVETSVGKTPLSYVVGARNIIPGLEAQLNGMRVNEEKTITVAPKDAYGEVDAKLFKDFPVASFPKGMDLKDGLVIQAVGSDGSRIPVKISQIKGGMVTVDFNHPMAGKTLTFKVKILSIENAPAAS